MGRIWRVTKYMIELVIAYVCAFFIRLFRPSLRNVWIISERGNDARDNGYFFYRYMVEKHPEIQIYYIIKSSSADAERITSDDRVEPNSFQHFVLFALSTVRISSHAWGGDVPEVDYYRKLGLYKLSRKRVVFLQHGIIKDYLPSLCYPAIRPDIFICGAEPEWRYIHDHFNHPEGVAQYTGLARYDTLSNFTAKNQILVMPTFRRYLQGISSEEFLTEEYYKAWQSLLESKEVIDLLEKKRIILIFYPHYEMQKYVHLFHSFSDRVIIADFDHYDVQTLLKESKLMVTDFSSVFFDFSYMRKPVIYYHFDRDRYIKGHYDYTQGYFDYDTMAPGKVVFDENSLVDEIRSCIESNFSVGNEYSKRRDIFFTKSDQQNCERIFNAIIRDKNGDSVR